MDRAGDLARRRVWAALGLEFAGLDSPACWPGSDRGHRAADRFAGLRRRAGCHPCPTPRTGSPSASAHKSGATGALTHRIPRLDQQPGPGPAQLSFWGARSPGDPVGSDQPLPTATAPAGHRAARARSRFRPRPAGCAAEWGSRNLGHNMPAPNDLVLPSSTAPSANLGLGMTYAARKLTRAGFFCWV